MGGTASSKVINKNTVGYLMSIDLDGGSLPENLNLDVGIESMFNKKGDWGTKFSPFKLNINDKAAIDVEDLKVDGEYLIVKYNNKYEGKTIVTSGKDIGIKVNGTLLKEADRADLGEKYNSKDANTRIYKIGDAKTVEIEGYDTMVRELHQDEAITVENK